MKRKMLQRTNKGFRCVCGPLIISVALGPTPPWKERTRIRLAIFVWRLFSVSNPPNVLVSGLWETHPVSVHVAFGWDHQRLLALLAV